MTSHTRTSRNPLSSSRHPLALAVALALMLPVAAGAVVPVVTNDELPTNPHNISGTINIPAAGVVTTNPLTGLVTTTLSISQQSHGAIVDWTSFNIGKDAVVEIRNPTWNAQSVTLNRVTGPDPSQIFGQLKADGSVFLVNSAGVTFAPGSSVSVGGLIASTLNISDAKFNAGLSSNSYTFGTGQAGQGDVTNAGVITANSGGLVALLGERVQNGDGLSLATISAPQGTVALGVGSTITVDIGGDGLTQLRIDASAINSTNDALRFQVVNASQATLMADGGQVIMRGVASTLGSVINNGVVQAHSLSSRAGRIILSSGSDDGVLNTVKIQAGTLDASGSAGGGAIDINAQGVASIDQYSTLNVGATNTGSGGAINVTSQNGIHAFGAFNAQGGASGGNGGTVKFTGSGFDLRGIDVDASAANGNAGTLQLDATNNIAVVNGSDEGDFPCGFGSNDPVTTVQIQDKDVSNALDAGTNVTITTHAGGTTNGNINFGDDVNILRSVGSASAPLTFRIDAGGGITSNDGFQVSSTAGPLNIVLDTNAFGGAGFQGINLSYARLLSNGGEIAFFGQNDRNNGFSSSTFDGIYLNRSVLDTRVGQSNTGLGGNVSLRGAGGYYGGGGGVSVTDSNIFTSTGSISIVGRGQNGGSGVALEANVFSGGSTLTTTSGDLRVTGIGSSSGSGGFGSRGLSSIAYVLQTDSGNIDLRGHGDVDNGSAFSDGISLNSRAQVVSRSGYIALSGSSEGGGAGVRLASTYIDSGTGLPYAAPAINSGNGAIIVRAQNDGSTDALVVGGTLTSTGTVNLRPGSVDGKGNLSENEGDEIRLGGALGFGLDTTELNRISATHVVLGSDIQQGRITVTAPVVYNHNLTLHSGAGGGIAVNAAVDLGARTLGLISAGMITQTAPITAASLLAVSSGASVALENAANQISSSTLAGTAAGNFTFVNAGTVGIGNVSATGFNAGGNAAQNLSGSGVTGTDVLIRALTGDMLLNANVSGDVVDLVSAGVFENTGGHTITAPDGWRVWGDTWVGETRGGLAGNGNLPNLYGCVFSNCSKQVVIPVASDHFLYTAQPTATITVADSARAYGVANGVFNFDVTGILPGDIVTQSITGSPTTTATQTSEAGTYAIGGNFVSPAGYLINLIPGTLAVSQLTLTYTADPYSRLYGDANPSFSGTVTGFLFSDTQANSTKGTLVFSSSATQASDVGSYAIVGSGLSSANYVFVQAPSNADALSITPATLTYIANRYSRIYGDPNPTFNGTLSGFRLADTQANATSGDLVFSTPATQASAVGTYAVDGGGLSATNYVFVQATDNASALDITPATLTYVANPYSRTYGDPNPVLDGTVEGFRLTDTQANATSGTLLFTTDATQGSNVGTYAIDGQGLSAANYVFVQASGNADALAITPATLVYTANPYSRIYGDPNPALDGTLSGFRLADTQANATRGELAFTTNATQSSNVGTYAINGGGLTAINYRFVQAAGNANALAITPATLVYASNAHTRLYGDLNGAFDGTISGFRLSDTQANATHGTLVFGSNATQASDVGTYAIDGSGLSATNYVFAQAVGNANALSITPATLTYNANARQRPVGATDGVFDGTVSGFRNGDTLSGSTDGTLLFGTSANTNSPTGSYAINGSGLSARNYLFTQASGNAVALTITPPPGTYTLDFIRETPVTYVYDRNFGMVGLCPAADLAADSRDKDGDTLAREWSRVRSRPNLANCVSTRQENSCGDF